MNRLLALVGGSMAPLSSALMVVACGLDAGDGAPETVRAPPQPPTETDTDAQAQLPRSDAADISLTPGDASLRDAVLALLGQLVGTYSGRRAPEYVFDPEDLQQVVSVAVGLPPREAMEHVHRELQRRHPGRISENFRFVLNHAGTVLLQVAILHASPNEYIAFCGSPISTGGYTGRYDAEVFDVMLHGEMHGFIEGDIERTVYRPGEMRRLDRREAGGYRLPEGGWMLEYARGNIVQMMPFGVIAPALFSSLDWKSAWDQISDFASSALENAAVP